MPLPTRPATSWNQSLDTPSRLFGRSGDDFELYEEDGEFVLTIEMPGFDTEDIDVAWNDGVLNVAAARENEGRGRRETYHRQFRFPKQIDDDAIEAHYRNGVLEVTLPATEGMTMSGKSIEVEG